MENQTVRGKLFHSLGGNNGNCWIILGLNLDDEKESLSKGFGGSSGVNCCCC